MRENWPGYQQERETLPESLGVGHASSEDVAWGWGGLSRLIGSDFSFPQLLYNFIRQNIFNCHLLSNYYVPGASHTSPIWMLVIEHLLCARHCLTLRIHQRTFPS